MIKETEDGYEGNMADFIAMFDVDLSNKINAAYTEGQPVLAIIVTLCGSIGGQMAVVCQSQEEITKFLPTITSLIESAARNMYENLKLMENPQ